MLLFKSNSVYKKPYYMRHIFILIYTKNVFEQRRNKSSLTRMVIKRSRVKHSLATQTHSPNGGRSLWWIYSCNMKKLFLSHHEYCIKNILHYENCLFLDNKKISSTRWKIFFPKDERNLFLDNKNIFSARWKTFFLQHEIYFLHN